MDFKFQSISNAMIDLIESTLVELNSTERSLRQWTEYCALHSAQCAATPLLQISEGGIQCNGVQNLRGAPLLRGED